MLQCLQCIFNVGPALWTGHKRVGNKWFGVIIRIQTSEKAGSKLCTYCPSLDRNLNPIAAGRNIFNRFVRRHGVFQHCLTRPERSTLFPGFLPRGFITPWPLYVSQCPGNDCSCVDHSTLAEPKSLLFAIHGSELHPRNLWLLWVGINAEIKRPKESWHRFFERRTTKR